MNVITINGQTITGSGDITVINGRILVNGKDYTPEGKAITINVTGDVDNLSVDACDRVSVKGYVGKIKTLSGGVEVIGDVHGDIQTMSGNVDAHSIDGSVKTMSGNIKTKK